jgi:hypothetical protein
VGGKTIFGRYDRDGVVPVYRSVARYRHPLEHNSVSHHRFGAYLIAAKGKSMPRITIGLIIFAVIFYIVGAKWPMLAQKVGIA